jgi:hypothetical protein
MLEDRSAEHGVVVDKFTDVTSDYSMTSRDYVVRADATAGALTITLPSAADAKGRIYSILARVADAANTVTIAHKGDSEQWSNIVLKIAGAQCLLYSDGIYWSALTAVDRVDDTAAEAGTDGTISSRSANPLGECNGFLVINGKYVPYWNDITP